MGWGKVLVITAAGVGAGIGLAALLTGEEAAAAPPPSMPPAPLPAGPAAIPTAPVAAGAPARRDTWRARSQSRGATARQRAQIDAARSSTDPGEVLPAYHLARSLGLDDVAQALGQRHTQLTMRRPAGRPSPARSEDADMAGAGGTTYDRDYAETAAWRLNRYLRAARVPGTGSIEELLDGHGELRLRATLIRPNPDELAVVRRVPQVDGLDVHLVIAEEG